MTKIVHIKTKKYDVYIGRGSIFGNPFRIGIDGDRKAVIEKYKKYFYNRIEIDEMFKNAVLKLKNKVLACYCRPDDGFKRRLMCHGQIIAAFIENVSPEEIG